jgi:ribosomal peptide maturation radical SAM protein 1
VEFQWLAEMGTGPSIALVQMPWAAVSQASIALGILKQTARNSGYEVDVHYLNIDFADRVGFETYEGISVRSALDPEWFFSCALFGPNGLRLIENSWQDLLSTQTGVQLSERLTALTGSDSLCQEIADEIVPQFIDDCLSRVDWARYKVIGFSTTFAQTVSSLLLAKRLKESYPNTRIVFGGANVDAEMGYEILKAFSWIDYVVHGEGEEIFGRLLDNIFSERYAEHLPGVSVRNGEQVLPGFADCQMIRDLNDSPIPDYSDYLSEVERTQLDRTTQIQLPFESSRGCWWGAKFHCTFCGLNRDTMSFRRKNPGRVYDELLELAGKYRCLTLNATDNIIDMDYFHELLPKLAETEVDFQIFYEVKANLRKDQIQKLAAAGITQIQPGIESLNTEILRMMQKGVTAIQNVQLLKWCFEYDVEPSWNILYGFPGEQAAQYEALPDVIRLLFHLPPPVGITPVIFERFSPYHFNAAKYGLKLTPFPIYRMLYPEALVDYSKLAYYFDGEWGQQSDPQEYIQPTIHSYRDWMNYWLKNDVLFYYERGPGFMTLHDNRPLNGSDELQARKIVLDETQARVYSFCDEIQSFRSIQQMLKEVYAPEETSMLLDQFVENGLMFREDNLYLSLAVRCRSAFRQRQTKRA